MSNVAEVATAAVGQRGVASADNTLQFATTVVGPAGAEFEISFRDSFFVSTENSSELARASIENTITICRPAPATCLDPSSGLVFLLADPRLNFTIVQGEQFGAGLNLFVTSGRVDLDPGSYIISVKSAAFAPVPEPASFLLLGAGLAFLGFAVRHRKAQHA